MKTVTLPFEEHERLIEIENKVSKGPVLLWEKTFKHYCYPEYDPAYRESEVINVTDETINALINILKESIKDYNKEMSYLKTQIDTLKDTKEELTKDIASLKREIKGAPKHPIFFGIRF